MSRIPALRRYSPSLPADMSETSDDLLIGAYQS